MLITKEIEAGAFGALRAAVDGYHLIEEESWREVRSISSCRLLSKGSILYRAGDMPSSFAFVARGLVRGYVTAEDGGEYNKNFFEEGAFPGSMTALLTKSPSRFGFEAIEDSVIVEIDFASFRRLVHERHDMTLFQVHYLERNWLLAKDARETQLVQEDATARYLRFLKDRPSLAARLAQYHIASHLGITPTQLSRVRKKIAAHQPM